MKRIYLSTIALSFAIYAGAQTIDRSIRPQPGPAPVINIADAQTFTLDNGLKVFVVEDHKNPSVTYSLLLDIYPAPEGNKAGLSGFVGQLITSGTKKRDKDKFNEEVDMIGGNLGASGGGMFGQCLTKNQDKLLDLMSDALMNANFKKDELDKMKKQAISSLQANETDADFILQNVAKSVTYGPDHPYGEVESDETINNVTLEDCNQYYKTYFRPNVGYMAVVGDVSFDQAKQLVTKYFGNWQKGDVPKTEYPTSYAPAGNQVDFSPRAGAVQSVVNITYPIKLKIGSPDVMKARVLNEILGGSSQGRLFQNLREKHGWTYGAYSSISSDPVVGEFNAYLKCRNEVTDSAISETLKEMQALRDNLVSEEDLKNTKQFIAGSFALGLESPQTIAQYAINVERFNMPKDYYKNYLKNLDAVKATDVQTIAKRYIAPGNAHIVVAGSKSELDKLKKFSADSSIQFYDAFGKPMVSTESKIINGVSVTDVLNKYIEAIGGRAAIESLKDLTVEASLFSNKVPFDVTKKIISPDKYSFDRKVTQKADLGGDISQSGQSETYYSGKIVINGESGFSFENGKKVTLPADAVKHYAPEGDLQLLLHPEKYNISYSLLAEEVVDGEPCYSVERGAEEGKSRSVQSYSKNTGLLVREIVTEQGKTSIKTYSDYKEVKGGNGYKIPYATTTMDPEVSKETVKSAKANSGVKEKDFK